MMDALQQKSNHRMNVDSTRLFFNLSLLMTFDFWSICYSRRNFHTIDMIMNRYKSKITVIDDLA